MRRLLACVALAAVPGAAEEAPVPQPGASEFTGGSQQLYEAYNQLHALSQQFDMPISSPAVVVVGRQTDGKSALIEALMGFQFNHVGGGTKTRRPIAMQMHYHPECEEPRCYLQTPQGEQQLSLGDLQAHIERENQRLASSKSFDAAEIIVRIEYAHCPNLLIIDTPGLLTSVDEADKAGGRAAGDPLEATQARQVEQLVRAKMNTQEHIILCVEETNNWHLAPARRLVAHSDPSLERTVSVSTKLDTKFAQFGAAAELEQFLRASPLRRRHPALLGGPFFTSVPAGRVGKTRQHVFRTNDDYRDALRQQEGTDLQYVRGTLSDGGANLGQDRLDCIGVSRLRSFLEELLKQRYLRNLAYIVPQLQQACARASSQLEDVDRALEELTSEQLRAVCARAAQRFKSTLEQAVRGSVDGAARDLGQTLQQEQLAGGGALCAAAAGAPGTEAAAHVAAEAAAEAAAATEGGDAALFGGAQYHRLMREFHAAVRTLPAVPVAAEDITNAMGISAQDDPMHLGRIGCAIALHRSSEQLGALISRLFVRLQHVMRRMLLYVLQQASPAAAAALEAARRGGSAEAEPPYGDADGGADASAAAAARRLEKLFERQIWSALEESYGSFLQQSAAHCLELCRRDLHSVATPPTHVRGGGAGVGATMAALAPLFARARAEAEGEAPRGRGAGGAGGAGDAAARRRKLRSAAGSGALPPAGDATAEEPATDWAPAGWYAESEAVDALVRRTVGLWRRQLAQAVQRKVHALFLMPFLEELPGELTASLDACCEPDSLRAFDLREARNAMLARREQLSQEQQRTRQLLRTFHRVKMRLGGAAARAAAKAS